MRRAARRPSIASEAIMAPSTVTSPGYRIRVGENRRCQAHSRMSQPLLAQIGKPQGSWGQRANGTVSGTFSNDGGRCSSLVAGPPSLEGVRRWAEPTVPLSPCLCALGVSVVRIGGWRPLKLDTSHLTPLGYALTGALRTRPTYSIRIRAKLRVFEGPWRMPSNSRVREGGEPARTVAV